MKKPPPTTNGAKSMETQRKGTHFQNQMKYVFAAFQSSPKTMLQVSVETGILRANLCRYIAKWRRMGKVFKIRDGICPITKCRAGFYSTDQRLFPPQIQTKLFQS